MLVNMLRSAPSDVKPPSLQNTDDFIEISVVSFHRKFQSESLICLTLLEYCQLFRIVKLTVNVNACKYSLEIYIQDC